MSRIVCDRRMVMSTSMRGLVHARNGPSFVFHFAAFLNFSVDYAFMPSRFFRHLYTGAFRNPRYATISR